MSEQVVTSAVTRLPVVDVSRFVIMDDDIDTQLVIKEVIAGLGGEALVAASEQEAVELAEKCSVRNFILDIHMGDDRSSEGLDALERLKGYDSSIFVGMLSNHPSKFREMAENLECDVFREKTPDRVADVRAILSRLLEVRCAEIQDARRELASDIHYHEGSSFGSGELGAEYSDVNLEALERLFSNPEWVVVNVNKYIVLVDGRIVAMGDEKGEVVKAARRDYPFKNRLVEFVSKGERVVEVWSPLGVEKESLL